MPSSDDETYTVPIADQRVFGAGIKRKRVPFVPASSATAEHNASSPASASIASRYLSIVGVAPERPASAPPAAPGGAVASAPAAVLCDICNTRIEDAARALPHESSLAHQICLDHSYGASHVDRTTKGFSVLQAYGWDPDSRKGLGAAGEGRLYPVKPKEKRDTLGIGMDVKTLKFKPGEGRKKVEKLNAKQAREMERKGVRRKQELQGMFTASDDVIKHLGTLQ